MRYIPAKISGDLDILSWLITVTRRHMRVYTYDAAVFPGYEARVRHPNLGYHIDEVFASRLRVSPVSTSDPRRATVFFVPFGTSACRFAKLDPAKGGQRANLHTIASCAAKMQQGVGVIGRRWPFLGKRNGSDHVWVSSHDSGHDVASLSDERFRANAHAIINSADIDPNVQSEVRRGAGSGWTRVTPFSPVRDIAAVPFVGGPPAVQLPPPARRSVLGFFAGTIRPSENSSGSGGHGLGVREQMVRAVGQFNHEAKASGSRLVRLVSGHLSADAYRRALLDSVFCLCPRGHAVWSPRLIEAIMHGCIPVVLADTYWPPLRCFLDWRLFSIWLPEARASHIGAELAAISASQTNAMHAELVRVRRWFTLRVRKRREPVAANDADAHDLLLAELYLRIQGCRSQRTAAAQAVL